MKLTDKGRPRVLVERRHSARWKVLVVVILAGGSYVFIAGDSGVLELSRQREELRQFEEQVAALEAQNDSLKHVLWSLENDPDYLEKVAREQYLMVKPDETLYLIQSQVDVEEEEP